MTTRTLVFCVHFRFIKCSLACGHYIFLSWEHLVAIKREFLVGNKSVRKDIDVNEHERISNITLRHKLKQKYCTVITLW